MILVTGGHGFVGSMLVKSLKDAVPAPSLQGASRDDIQRIVRESHAEVIIHTAAIADMGACEADPDASYEANVRIPTWIAEASAGKKLICFSTDQVYNGSPAPGPYSETDVHPANVYARHKLEMEQRVLDLQPSAVMLRAEWMYDLHSEKGNYLLNALHAEKSMTFSSSQYRGITYLREVAENMENVIALPGGAYNFGSETTQSIYEISKEFLSLIRKDLQVLDGAPGHNLWMNCSLAARGGVVFSDALSGLFRCADDYHLTGGGHV